jgi:hypothetical protein
MGEVEFAAVKAGDHLRVSRRLYYHHGIYVGDGRVVQFGGGAGNKRRHRIEEVSFAAFASKGRVELVDQARLTWIGLWPLPPPLPPDQIVARARCLVAHNADAAYNLIGAISSPATRSGRPARAAGPARRIRPGGRWHHPSNSASFPTDTRC